MRRLDISQVVDAVEIAWNEDILPALKAYIKIPNLSPGFDKEWEKNGHMEAAVQLFTGWAHAYGPNNLMVDVNRIEGRTPLLFIEAPATDGSDRTVLVYGHLDKQPECGMWREGLHMHTPVQEGDRLYGRGAADDGYAMFAAIEALRALKEQNMPHARVVILIEASEESGSPDLPAHLEALKDRIGTPDLVICLDSSCKDYERLWLTTSLRGVLAGDLQADVLTHEVHSGSFGGLVEPSFSTVCACYLAMHGVLEEGRQHDPPTERKEQAKAVAEMVGDSFLASIPYVEGCTVADAPEKEVSTLILKNTWEYSVVPIGIAGIPSLDKASPVIHPSTTLRLAIRVPPLDDPKHALTVIQDFLDEGPPFLSKVTFTPKMMVKGWNAPPLAPWLQKSVDDASMEFFGNPMLATGEGGTIPFNAMLAEKFPDAQFVVTGVLGPESNAHGPNEFLHIPTAKKVTASVAKIIADHAAAR